MVSGLSIFFMVISVILSLILPIVLIIYFRIKEKYDLLIAAFGGVGFYFSQVMVKMGVLNSLSSSGGLASIARYPLLSGIILAVTGGILAEITRILVFMFLVKKEERNWKNGLAYGLGYGGIESIMMVGRAYLSFLGYSYVINSGVFDSLIGTNFTVAEALQIKSELMQPAYIYLLGGLERTAFLVIQVALSLIVMYGVKEAKPAYFGYAVLAQLILNVPIVLLGQLHKVLSLAWLLAFAYLSYKYILKTKSDRWDILPNS